MDDPADGFETEEHPPMWVSVVLAGVWAVGVVAFFLAWFHS